MHPVVENNSGRSDDARPGMREGASPQALRDSPDARRRLLARWMLGHWDDDAAGLLDAAGLEAMKEQAWHEGVAVLVGDRLARNPAVPEAIRRIGLDWARGQAAGELGRRARLRALLACVEQAGIDALLLKGAALAEWLYPAPYLREFSDVDLLFASRDHALRAAEALKTLGYAMPYRPGRFRHELACHGADGVLDLDLHWALSDWPALERLPDFARLHAAAAPLPGLAARVCGLDASDAFLHACVHRASNLVSGLGDRLKWLYDLHLLAAALSSSDAGWQRLVDVAASARVAGIGLDGLRASMATFNTRPPPWALVALAEASNGDAIDPTRLDDWRYVQRSNFMALGWRDRIAWLRERLFPPVAHLRALYGERHGMAGLWWQRLKRAGKRLLNVSG